MFFIMSALVTKPLYQFMLGSVCIIFYECLIKPLLSLFHEA